MSILVSQQGFTYGNDYTQRRDTIKKLLDLVISHRVIHVRGTPTSGKTVLSRMLYTHILQEYQAFSPIYITWELPGSEGRSEGKHWLSYLCEKGSIPEESFWHQHNAIFVLDEAQLSYQETSFWVECIKSQKDNDSGPRFVLFSSFGSASHIALKIRGSSPIDLHPNQRVSLFPGPNGVSLYFTFKECEDLSKSMTLNRGFNVAEDVLQHLFTLTNGHPGLFHGLFKALIDREASACSSKYYCFRSLSYYLLLRSASILPMQVNYSMLICAVPYRIFVPRLSRQDWCL
jgi:hypothetical protein